MKKKICVITGSRAEYGLLTGLIKKINSDNDFILQLIVTNMHLSPEFGETYKEIENDGIKISKKIEILMSSDTPTGIAKTTGLGFIGFADAFQELIPDLIIILGDRYEILAAAATALFFKIPIAHISGGEVTEGAFDDSIRHAITKMSRLHFTSHETYRKRVIQLGEDPNYVFNVGSLSIDNITKLQLMNKNEFENSINFKLNKKNILVTYHSETNQKGVSQIEYLNELLKVIDELEDTNIIFTLPNSDDQGRELIQQINDYTSKNNKKATVFSSLGYLRYLSALQFVDAVVGNSSSGIVEAPSFKTGTINIGNRQKGRIRAKSIIDCNPEYNSIKASFKKLYSKEFQHILVSPENPFGNGKTAQTIIDILKNIEYDKFVLNKQFKDYAI
jgi:GDP/UDP-N,N'-diacetylbacillosamine 2-epimerase (hydrolysing)